MEITPCLGMGDLLLYKMVDNKTSLNLKTINVSTQLAKTYRQYPERFIEFTCKFIRCLFPNVDINIVDIPNQSFFYDGHQYNIDTPYIYDHINITPHEIPYKNYITIHTKVRLFSDMNYFLNHDLYFLNNFFKTYKTDKTIIIMGERDIEDCLETKVLGITSLYMMMKQLGNNNVIIDKTKEILYSGNPSFSDFEYDVNLIHNSDMNIVIGVGGALALCQACSENNRCFIGQYGPFNHENMIQKYNGVYRDVNEFVNSFKEKKDINTIS